MIKNIPYFPRVNSISFNDKTQRFNFDVMLYNVDTPTGLMLNMREARYKTGKMDFNYTFHLEEGAKNELLKVLKDKPAISGVYLTFHVWHELEWKRVSTVLHSLLAKRIFLSIKDILEVSLHQLADSESETEEEEEMA